MIFDREVSIRPKPRLGGLSGSALSRNFNLQVTALAGVESSRQSVHALGPIGFMSAFCAVANAVIASPPARLSTAIQSAGACRQATSSTTFCYYRWIASPKMHRRRQIAVSEPILARRNLRARSPRKCIVEAWMRSVLASTYRSASSGQVALRPTQSHDEKWPEIWVEDFSEPHKAKNPK